MAFGIAGYSVDVPSIRASHIFYFSRLAVNNKMGVMAYFQGHKEHV